MTQCKKGSQAERAAIVEDNLTELSWLIHKAYPVVFLFWDHILENSCAYPWVKSAAVYMVIGKGMG